MRGSDDEREARVILHVGGWDIRPGKLTLASPAPNSLFTFNEVIARELGFYDEEGLDRQRRGALGSDQCRRRSSRTAMPIRRLSRQAMLWRELPEATSDCRTTNGRGAPRSSTAVVVPEDSEYQEMADLKGTTIGLASPEQDLALLASALQEVGLSLDDVEHVVVGPGGPAVAESLRTAKIDAYTGTLADFAAFAEAGLETEEPHPRDARGLAGGWLRLPCRGLSVRTAMQ